MSADLIALGLLAEGPLHGYELRRRLTERGLPTFASISFGALYHALERLEERGSVQRQKSEREGRRPERVVFTITTQGKGELQRLVLEALSSFQRVFHPLDLGLAFAVHLRPGELGNSLRERVGKQRELVSKLEAHIPAVQERIEQAARSAKAKKRRVLAIGPSMLEHALALERAELAWLEALSSRLAAETLDAESGGSNVVQPSKKDRGSRRNRRRNS